MLSIVTDVSAILVARTTFLEFGGVGSKILACMSLGKFAYTGSIRSSFNLLPSRLTRSCSISWHVSISSCPVRKTKISPSGCVA